MSIVGEIFKGMLILSFFAVAEHSCSVRKMATEAAKAHERGLSSYGAYSRMLTGHQGSLAKPKASKSGHKDFK